MLRFPLPTLSVYLCCIGLAVSISATQARADAADRDTPWRVTVDAGAVHRFDAAMSQGGEFERSTYLLRVSAMRRWTPALQAGLSVGYEHDDYSFDLPVGRAEEEPWGAVRTLGLSLPLRYRASDRWSVFAMPRLRYAAEEDASLNDGREAGLLAGASYRVSEHLSIGPGLGAFSEIGSGTDVFPILLVDWQITETLSLETGRGLAASRGPGLTVRWTPQGRWSFGVAARYEKRRFRLDDSGAAPDGIGEDKAVPIALTAIYAPNEDFKFSLLAGAEFAGNLRLETRQGTKITDEDYDTAVFAGAVLSMSF